MTRKKQTDKPHIEYIQWEDAASSAGWFTRDEAKKWMSVGHLIEEVGWILRDDGKYLGMAARRDTTPDASGFTSSEWGNLQIIPKTWIRKRKRLDI